MEEARQQKNGGTDRSSSSEEDDGYENDDCISALRKDALPPAEACQHKKRAPSKGGKEDDDFSFVDPKRLVADPSHSATNLNSYQLENRKPAKTVDDLQADKPAHQIKRSITGSKNSKRQGNDRSESYSYVSPEVEWALGRHLNPSTKPKLDSSSEEEEVRQPLYENERVAINFDDDDDSLFEDHT